ncbi:MAG: glutamate--tRNA ligase [Candidatus Omnitrophica bacterium]|nr:glutamate--tRNA ligase [Candidatus Omnitrophota bacterium]
MNENIQPEVRVRFAPSPTGYLHIGGARTALFNWVFAKSRGGKFILRIEDTDTQRSKKEYLDEILNSLKWMGMDWDEIYYQSQRFNIYREYAEKLLKEGKAYKDGEAIIFKLQPQPIKMYDVIRGEIEFDASLIKDQVLIKSDGSPTYNFACVIDDALMNITHIIRGDDHISNTPKQIVLYEASGFKLPKFAHLPLILGMEGGRLSKRTGATAISDYRKMGYLPAGIVNYLLLLGWSPRNNQEVIGIKDAIKSFSLKNANKTAAAFDINKLKWINSQYIKKEDPEKLTEFIIPLLIEKGFIKEADFDRKQLAFLVKLFQPRMDVLPDFLDWADYFFTDKIDFNKEGVEKYLSSGLSKEFSLLCQRFAGLDNFTDAAIEQAFRALVAELNIQAGALVHPVRLALTGKTVGPGLFETIALLGREKTLKRLQYWIERWEGKR